MHVATTGLAEKKPSVQKIYTQSINDNNEPVLQAKGNSVTEQRISLHLSQSNSSVLLPAFHWLLGNCCYRTGASHLRLITYHVSIFKKNVNINQAIFYF